MNENYTVLIFSDQASDYNDPIYRHSVSTPDTAIALANDKFQMTIMSYTTGRVIVVDNTTDNVIYSREKK